MSKSPQNHQVKEKSGFWLLNPASKSESVLLALLFLFLPTQLGKHFWPAFTLVSGIRVDYLSPTIYSTDILIILLLLLCVYRIGLLRIWQLMKQQAVLFLFLAFFLETAIFSARPLLSLYWWIKLVEFSFFGYYIARSIKYPLQLSIIAICLSIGAYFESLLGILQYVAQGSLNGWLYYLGERSFSGATPGIANASINGMLILRPYGTFSHPNVLAAYLLIASLWLVFFLIRTSRGFSKLVFAAMVICSSVALVLTLSRVVLGLWFLLICSTLVLYVFKTKSYRKSLWSAVFAGCLMGLILLPFLKTVFLRFAQTSVLEEAYTQRTQLIANTLILIKQHPLTGVGLGNFIPSIAPLQPPLSLGLYLQPVHNIFLLLTAETGLFGFSLFFIFLVRTIMHVFKRIKNAHDFQREYAFFALLLCSSLFLGLFDHYFITLQQGQLLITMIFGLCWSKLTRDPENHLQL